MRRKYLNTLIAVAILLALWGSFRYYDQRKSREAPKAESTPQEKILALESSHIQSLALKPRSGDALRLQRQGSNWVITDPRKLAADSTAISGLLTNLTDATVDQVVNPRPANLKDFGLDPPGFTLEVSTNAKPAQLALLLGDDTPTSGGVYAQVGGNPRVITLPSYLKSSLEKNLFDLRDKRAVTLDPDQIQKIETESQGKHWTLVKNPEGVWDLTLPPAVRADRFALDGLLNQIRNASMQTVLAEDKKTSAKYGLGSPQLTVTLTSPAGRQKLILGKKDGDRYDAMNSALDPIFTLNSDFTTQLQKDPADLREKGLFSFSSFDVKRLEVDTPKGHRVFEQQKEKWRQTTPSSKDIATAKMETLLNRIHDLRAQSFPKETNLSALGLSKPAYKFQVQFGDKNQTQIVEVSKAGDHSYARLSTDSVACELPKNALDDVDKALNEL